MMILGSFIILEKYVLICLICCSTAFSFLVQAKNQNKRADETDTIIKKIMDGYEKGVHPNSDQKSGAVQVQIGITPLALNIVSNIIIKHKHVFIKSNRTSKIEHRILLGVKKSSEGQKNDF